MEGTPRSARWTKIAVLAPLGAAALGCVLIAPQVRSAVAPFFGPWAGYLYGHADCTLANVAPLWSGASTVLVLTAAALLRFAPPRRWVSALVFGAALSWSLSALASVANTRS